jgi:hypothetical protein
MDRPCVLLTVCNCCLLTPALLLLLQRHKRGLCQQDALLQHVSQVWGRDAVDLLAGLLLYDPAERCTAAQALAMPFLAGNVSGVS